MKRRRGNKKHSPGVTHVFPLFFRLIPSISVNAGTFGTRYTLLALLIPNLWIKNYFKGLVKPLNRQKWNVHFLYMCPFMSEAKILVFMFSILLKACLV